VQGGVYPHAEIQFNLKLSLRLRYQEGLRLFLRLVSRRVNRHTDVRGSDFRSVRSSSQKGHDTLYLLRGRTKEYLADTGNPTDVRGTDVSICDVAQKLSPQKLRLKDIEAVVRFRHY